MATHLLRSARAKRPRLVRDCCEDVGVRDRGRSTGRYRTGGRFVVFSVDIEDRYLVCRSELSWGWEFGALKKNKLALEGKLENTGNAGVKISVRRCSGGHGDTVLRTQVTSPRPMLRVLLELVSPQLTSHECHESDRGDFSQSTRPVPPSPRTTPPTSTSVHCHWIQSWESKLTLSELFHPDLFRPNRRQPQATCFPDKL